MKKVPLYNTVKLVKGKTVRCVIDAIVEQHFTSLTVFKYSLGLSNLSTILQTYSL